MSGLALIHFSFDERRAVEVAVVNQIRRLEDTECNNPVVRVQIADELKALREARLCLEAAQ